MPLAPLTPLQVYHPLLLLGKKRYAGMKYDEGRSPAVLDTKGLECQRRDNFSLLPDLQRAALKSIMAFDPDAADALVRRELERLRCTPTHELDKAPLVITKELTKSLADYDTFPPHARVAYAMQREGLQVNVRDRIPYLVRVGRGSVGAKAVHPDMWDDAHDEIDSAWYCKQITAAMRRILTLSSADPDAVFAPVMGAVTGTGASGILRALGAPPDLVWRSHATVVPPVQLKRKRQLMLQDLFQRT